MLKMPPTPWLVWLPPTLYRVSTIQEDLRPGTGQHDAEQIISYLSWKRVLVRVWVTTFCLSLAMSFIWSCVRLLFRSQPSCSEPLIKSFEVSKNAAFCQRSKRVLNQWFNKPPSPLILPLLKLMMGGFKEKGISVRLWPRGTDPRVYCIGFPDIHNLDRIPLSPRNM